jgi:hypothetical protein
VLARRFEAAGLATVSISLVLEHTALLRPPRALYVPFPFGLPLGHPGDAVQQRRVLDAALALFDGQPPVLRELTGEADDDEPGAPVQVSTLGLGGSGRGGDGAAEVTRMRQYQQHWVARTGRTSVGLTGVPPTRFRGLVRFLEAVAEGQLERPRECPPETELPYFIRWCCDDLKALYAEARFVMRPEDSGDAVARWLWADTALGDLIRRVGQRLSESDDPLARQVAYGIAR